MREKLTLPLAAVAASLLLPALVIAFFGSPAGDSHAIYVFHFFVVIVTTAQALRTLKAEEGTAFDGRCVAALERTLTTNEGVEVTLTYGQRAIGLPC